MSHETPPPADAGCPHLPPPSGRDEHKPGRTDGGAAAGTTPRQTEGAPAARRARDDAATAGRNRIHLIVDDLDAEIDRPRTAGLAFRSDPVSGPGGRQILLADPAGNLIELFQPAPRPAYR